MRIAAPMRVLPVAALLGLLVAGCSPTVKIEAPDKPIEINLNVKIEQDVRVRVEKDLESVFDKNSKIF
jgi:predicted component of type VI protein secretion system